MDTYIGRLERVAGRSSVRLIHCILIHLQPTHRDTPNMLHVKKIARKLNPFVWFSFDVIYVVLW